MGFRNTLLIFGFLTLFSCGTSSIEGNDECRIDSECPDEQICRLGVCGGREKEPRKIGFTLIPPDGSSLPVQRIRAASIQIDTPLQLLVNSGARVSGKISFIGSTISPSGSLTFSDEMSEFSVQTQAERGEYSVVLPVSSYRITFVPTDPNTPSKVWRNIRFERDSDPKLTIPAPEYTQISGTLSFVDEESDESRTISGARIFAVSKETGSLSTVTTTNDEGSFEIRVLPDSGEYDLRVISTQENKRVPDTTFDTFFISTEKGWTSSSGEDIATLPVSLGRYSVSNEIRRVKLKSQNPLDSWEEFDVLISYQAGKGEVRLRPLVGRNGEFEIPEVDTNATFNIIAPPQSLLSSVVVEGSLVDISDIFCPEKLRLKGRVVNMDGDGVASRLEATPSKGEGVRILATTNEEGEFEIGLEPFPYVVTAIPQDGAIARAIFNADGKNDKVDTERTITIPEPTLVWGKIFIQSGDSLDPLEDVTIQAFRGKGKGRLKIGEARSDEDGSFKLIVPKEQN